MRFQTPLISATLIRRYKRFLADVRLESGREVVAHCPNPGSMTGLQKTGARVWLEPNNDPKKKLGYGWRLIEYPAGNLVGIDTSIPNRVVHEALKLGKIKEVVGYDEIRPEMKYGENSRIDFYLSQAGLPDVYLEVKSVTLRRDAGWAEFPDCVTARGTKHLNELRAMVQQGHRAVMLYLLQRTDCDRFRVAEDLDPAYGAASAQARAAGVEMICYGTDISPQGVLLARPVPIK
ncbi:MAG TPA: DNA/RNA nuclease SfsA [Rhodobacteraceae bacterium]|jgi:sugar fermentation stimulation protein A|nr:DNA/RNA nuclease SfsA [Paracoccaceae bacterium]